VRRINLFLIASLLLTCAFWHLPQSAYSLYTGDISPAEPEFSSTRLIVKLKPEADRMVRLGKVQGKVTTGLARLDSLHFKFGVQAQKKLFEGLDETALRSDRFSSVYILQVPEGTDLKQMIREYKDRPEIEYVEPDYRLQLFEEVDDPLFPHQWYLNNTGQGYLGINRIPGDGNDSQIIKYGTQDADMDVLEVFQSDHETTIPLVGIIDTGVDLDHVDLMDNIWVNPGEDLNDDGAIDSNEINGIDDDHNGYADDFYGWDFSGDLNENDQIIEDNDPTDYFGHGTHCAGIVAATRDNSEGISGISVPCRIMSVKLFPYAFHSLGARSIIYAADNGCDLINMSWGGPFASKLIEDALNYAIEKGVLPVASAGNSGREEYFFPVSFPFVLSVGASNSFDQVTGFSTYGEHIDVVAPGEDILSLRADETDMYAGGGASGVEPNVHIVQGRYYLADGTSMASPCAVGVAAGIIAASPGISKQRVVEIIEESADDIIYPYGGDSLYSPGKDEYSGYGRVNLNSALQLVSGRLAKIDYPYENAIVSGEVAIMGTASGDSFQNYVLEVGAGFSPEAWIQIKSSDVPARKDTLGTWNSTGTSGLYTIRLTVGDQNQSEVHVRANNEVYVKITTPSDGDTVVRYSEVWGYTIAPDFSSYKLEYGFGESPSAWIPIDNSTKMVADDLLGNWLVSFLEETSYALRLTVQTNSSQIYADTVVVFVKSIASGGWFTELSSTGSLSPAVGDIDGDGYDEVVVGVGSPEGWDSKGGTEVFSHQGEREVGWPKDTDKNMMSSPALGDLDGDQIDDVVICCEQKGVCAYLSSSPDWSAKVYVGGSNLWSLATPVIADLENDDNPEVLTMNDMGDIYAWRNNGESVISGSNGFFAKIASGTGSGFPCLAVADLDGDGYNEVIGGSAHGSWNVGSGWTAGGIYVWDNLGNLVLAPKDYPDVFVAIYGIAIANIDEKGDLEIIALGADTDHLFLSAFKKNGTQVTNFPIRLEGLSPSWWFGNHPAVADLEGDGILEIVISVWAPGNARIYGWHQDGTPLGSLGPSGLLISMRSPEGERKGDVLRNLGDDIGEVTARIKVMSKDERSSLFSSSEDPFFASAAETFGSPVLADVNGDGNLDILARAGYYSGTGYERVFAWDYEGNLISGFPLFASAVPSPWSFFPYSPLVADVDKNGKLNILVVSDWPDYKLICWELDTDFQPDTGGWPKYMHDRWNSGRHGFKPDEGETVNIPPSNFRVRSWDDSSVVLGWSPKAPWASLGYNIYRATTTGQVGEEINSELIPQSDSQYQDCGLVLGESYYYTITNVNTVLQESDRSLEVGITLGQPSAPQGLVAQTEGGRVTLSWQPCPVEENVEHYLVYHKGPNNSHYLFADTVTIETSYVDSSIKWSGAHGYRITALGWIGLESYPSEVWVNIPSNGQLPQDLRVDQWYGTDVILSWRITKQGDGCNVYRSTMPGIFKDPPVNAEFVDDPLGTIITYQDTGLTEGTTWYYVTTQVRAGIENAPSNQVEFLAGRPQTLTQVAGEVRDCHIVVHWNPSSEGDVEGYRVYDRPSPDRGYLRLAYVEQDTIYVDPATDDSLLHQFAVTAIDSLDMESFLPTSFPPPGAIVEGPLYPPGPPSEFQIISYTDTSITFKVFAKDVQAYNIYRGEASGKYDGPPINSEPIPSYHPYQFVYRFSPLMEGKENFFAATCLKQNQCGTAEGRIDTSAEISFVPGIPEKVSGISAELDTNCNAVITWNPNPEGDIIKYRVYYRIVGFDNMQVLDSVFVPQTMYIDTTISDTLVHRYAVTAVDSLGLESPLSQTGSVSPSAPSPPWSVWLQDWSDTSATLQFILPTDPDIIGYNVYRSLKSFDYAHLEPINHNLLAVDSTRVSYYTDSEVEEGTTYFYTGTTVNKCGLESPIWMLNNREASVLVGQPHEPHVEVQSGKKRIIIHISSEEIDIKGYMISRSENQGAFRLMDPLFPDTVFADTSVVAGVQYHYKVMVIDTLGLEGEPSGMVEGCLMTFDKGIMVVDMTRGRDKFDGVKGDSVDAFYNRALDQYDYIYIHSDERTSYFTLFQLSPHPVVIIHSVDEPAGYGIEMGAYRVLGSYLQAGGALLIEGRKNLWQQRLSPEIGGFWDFSPGEFKNDYLGIDSAYIPDNLQSGTKPEFIGASRTLHMQGYPEQVEVDTFRVNHAYDPSWLDLQGKLPGVGYFVPLDESEVIYTFVSAYDTSVSNGKPVALKHFTDDFAVIYFDFPLYFIQEDIATQILHQALSELEEFANRPEPLPYAGDLAGASVYPNPFKSYAGHTRMTFDGLTDQAKIEVFTLTGEKVCTMEEKDGDGELAWDVTNSKGRKLASGIYIYRITNDQGHEKISRLAVIR
jgi:fibronectin type 3 domain-containing protein